MKPNWQEVGKLLFLFLLSRNGLFEQLKTSFLTSTFEARNQTNERTDFLAAIFETFFLFYQRFSRRRHRRLGQLVVRHPRRLLDPSDSESVSLKPF